MKSRLYVQTTSHPQPERHTSRTVRTDGRSLQDALDDLPDLFECFYNDSPAPIRVPIRRVPDSGEVLEPAGRADTWRESAENTPINRSCRTRRCELTRISGWFRAE